MRFSYTAHLFRDNAGMIRRRSRIGLAAKPGSSRNGWLRVSGNGRYLIDRQGAPLLLVGDSPQGLLVCLSAAEMETYMSNRAKYGFNCIQVHALGGTTFGGRADRTTYDSIAPFTTAGDITTPNSNYFARLDQALAIAEKHGLIVMLTAAEYIDSQGLFTNATNCHTYGEYLGARYADYRNIIWCYGNDFQDWETEPTKVACFAAVLDGVAEYAPNHLQTVWLDYFFSLARESSDFDSRIDLDFCYTYFPTYDGCLDSYALTPAKPVFMGESNYESESLMGYTTTALHCRKQNYWSLLSGGCGTFYCNGPDTYKFASGWASRLDGTYGGPGDVARMVDLFKSIEWWKLVPDSSHTVMTAGYGTYADGESGGINTNDYAAAAVTSDAVLFLAYLPSSRQVTVDMSQIAGSTALCRWYNPTDGTYTAIGTYDCSGSRNFTPGTGDWVLRIDRAS